MCSHHVFIVVAAALVLVACGERSDSPQATPAAVAPAPSATAAAGPSESRPVPLADNGQTIAVPADANPQAAAVAEALRTQSHPERLTPMVAPRGFDPVAYAANPEAYLAVTEPGRVFDTATPTAATPILRPVSATTASVAPGGTMRLAVRTAPGAPVSWLSTDLGSFDNRLVSMTVEADADGVAEVDFTATSGVAGRVTILAGSPLASGQVRFVMDVQATPLMPVPDADR